MEAAHLARLRQEAPTFEEGEPVAQWTHASIERVLLAHGRTLDGLHHEPWELTHEQPVLASCYAASAGDVQLLGENAGQQTLKLVRAVRSEARALAEFGGVNVHAEVAIDGRAARAASRPQPTASSRRMVSLTRCQPNPFRSRPSWNGDSTTFVGRSWFR